jgi:hypothetical protein
MPGREREAMKPRATPQAISGSRAHRAAMIASCALIAACSDEPPGMGPGDEFVPTDPAVLSTGSPGADEDPSVLRAADGSLFVAWFSDRGGNSDVYITRWQGGGWIAPARVTTHADADFAPSLYQDAAGVFHIAWFRFLTQFPFHRYVLYNRSTDGLSWNPANEIRIGPTAPGVGVEDWVPTISATADGTLHIYFVSRIRSGTPTTYDLYGAESRDGGDTWSEPAALPALDDPAEHDHLPFAARTASGVAIAWVRHDTSNDLPWENTTSDLMVAESVDGSQWVTAVDVTHDDGLAAHDLFPGLFTDRAGRTRIVWLTTRSGAPKVVALPMAEIGNYPAAAVELPLLGYSPRVATTTTAGVSLGVWVAGPTGAQEIYYRFFSE